MEINLESEGERKKAPFLGFMKVGGEYAPTPDELAKLMAQVDLVDKLRGIDLGEHQREGGMTLVFDSVEQSHLFALAVMDRLNTLNICSNSPADDFFQEGLLDDFRIDTWQLSFTETRLVTDKIEGVLLYKYADEDGGKRVEKINEAIGGLLEEIAPGLRRKVVKFGLA